MVETFTRSKIGSITPATRSVSSAVGPPPVSGKETKLLVTLRKTPKSVVAPHCPIPCAPRHLNYNYVCRSAPSRATLTRCQLLFCCHYVNDWTGAPIEYSCICRFFRAGCLTSIYWQYLSPGRGSCHDASTLMTRVHGNKTPKKTTKIHRIEFCA